MRFRWLVCLRIAQLNWFPALSGRVDSNTRMASVASHQAEQSNCGNTEWLKHLQEHTW